MTMRSRTDRPSGKFCPCGHEVERHAPDEEVPGQLYCVPCWGNTDTDNYCRVRL